MAKLGEIDMKSLKARKKKLSSTEYGGMLFEYENMENICGKYEKYEKYYKKYMNFQFHIGKKMREYENH